MNSEIPARRSQQIFEVDFDPRLKTYVNIGTVLFLTITIIGIPLIPFWLIFGRRYINRYFSNLFCELTTRALKFKKGVWFQTERTVPLDKIQDLTFKEGPVLRYFGLSSLQVETAGNSAQGGADMTLVGIVDARSFREKVLDQRDEITDKPSPASDSINTLSDSETSISLLKEIHKTLQNIEQRISDKG